MTVADIHLSFQFQQNVTVTSTGLLMKYATIFLDNVPVAKVLAVKIVTSVSLATTTIRIVNHATATQKEAPVKSVTQVDSAHVLLTLQDVHVTNAVMITSFFLPVCIRMV